MVVTTVEEAIVDVVVVELVVVVVELLVVVELELEVLLVVSELEVVDNLVLVVVIVPLKDRSSEGHGLGAQPRRLRSNVAVWLATSRLLSLKLITSPVLQLSPDPHTFSE